MCNICLDVEIKEKPVEIPDFTGQWETLLDALRAAPRTSLVPVRLSYFDDSCTAYMAPESLYLFFEGDKEPFSYIDADGLSIDISSGALYNAVRDVCRNKTKADKKSKVLVVFSLCEAARFRPLRGLLYWAAKGKKFDWTKTTPLLKQWDKILAFCEKEKTHALTGDELRNYWEHSPPPYGTDVQNVIRYINTVITTKD